MFQIKIFVFEHNHEIGKDLYQHYASQRKPDEDGMKEILKNYSKNGAKLATLVNN